MTISVAQFRADYPEFSSSSKFPNGQVQFWLNFAYQFMNAARWGSSLDMGAELFAAHNLTIEARAQAEAAGGGVPGGTVGAVTSKSVDKVSVSYDVNAGIELNAGHWNLSVYGTRYIKLARMMGSGPLQIGIGYVDPINGPGWPGPLTTPGFTNFS